MYLPVIMILFYLNGNILPEYLCIWLYDFWLFSYHKIYEAASAFLSFISSGFMLYFLLFPAFQSVR